MIFSSILRKKNLKETKESRSKKNFNDREISLSLKSFFFCLLESHEIDIPRKNIIPICICRLLIHLSKWLMYFFLNFQLSIVYSIYIWQFYCLNFILTILEVSINYLYEILLSFHGSHLSQITVNLSTYQKWELKRTCVANLSTVN